VVEREPLWNDPAGPITGRSTSSATCTGAFGELAAPPSPNLGYAVGRRRAAPPGTPTGGKAVFVGDPGGPGGRPTPRRCCGLVDGHDRRGVRALGGRQPRGPSCSGALRRGATSTTSHGPGREPGAASRPSPPRVSAGRPPRFLDGLARPTWSSTRAGWWVAAPPGLPAAMQRAGRPAAVRGLLPLYGDTTGRDPTSFGLPVRYPWAGGLPAGRAHGRLRAHARCPTRSGLNGTICLDTGVRLRRQAYRNAVPEREAGVGASQGRVLPAGPAAGGHRYGQFRTPLRRAGAGRARPSRMSPASGSIETRPDRVDGDHPRGERRRRPRGDEPVRHRPAAGSSTCRRPCRRRPHPTARASWSTPPTRSAATARRA